MSENSMTEVSQSKTTVSKTTVCILGGGLAGGILAIALGIQGIPVTVLDPKPGISSSPETAGGPPLDHRTAAITMGSRFLFEEWGIWPFLEHVVQPIHSIRVVEGKTPWSLHFHPQSVGHNEVGYIVENRFLYEAIEKRISSLPSICWRSGTKGHLTRDFLISESSRQTAFSSLLLSSGEEVLTTQLIVGAEGRFSPSCEEQGISSYTLPDYHQKALVFSVTHAEPHEGIAWEVFYPEGPLAFLPLISCSKTGQYRSGVVWTLSSEMANAYSDQTNEFLEDALQNSFSFLSNLKIIGNKSIYPLVAKIPRTVVKNRFVAVGDAAHALHPIAGQGVNLTWRDIGFLADHLGKAYAMGLDVGSFLWLKQYERARRLDTLSALIATDGLVRLFSNRSSILTSLRKVGLGIVQNSPTLKKFFIQKAMGI